MVLKHLKWRGAGDRKRRSKLGNTARVEDITEVTLYLAGLMPSAGYLDTKHGKGD